MKFKPNYTILIITSIIAIFIAYLFFINSLYGFTHNIIIQGDIALPHTINYVNTIILFAVALIISYILTILIQNFIPEQKT